MAGILLRLLGPFFTKAVGTNSFKAIGINFDHFSEKFPHGRVDFVYLGGLIVFFMATLVISTWQLEVNSIVVVFLQEFFTLDILGFGLTWEFTGMVASGVTVHSCSWGGVLAILIPQLQLAQVSYFLFVMRIVNCNV